MRPLLLFALLASVASAQPGTETRPTAIEDPGLLFSMIGQDWEVADAVMPLPDSGAVEAGLGTVWWPVADDEVAWVRADVQDDQVVQLTVKPGEEVSAENLAQVAQEIKYELGPAGPNGFFDASDWSELAQLESSMRKPGIKVQVSMLVEDRLLILRLTPGSY